MHLDDRTIAALTQLYRRTFLRCREISDLMD
jgi:hypothetical protein